jgi:two-component sensor histidine kinase
MLQRLTESRILEAAENMRENKSASILFALISFAAALLARFAVDDVLPPGFPFLTFFPAVILTGLFAGTRAGLLCLFLCTLAAWYWFIPPFNTFDLSMPALVAILFFVGVGAVDLVILHIMNIAVEQVRRDKEASEEMAKQQTVLFQELQHRVANNLNFVSNLLTIHQVRLPADNNLAHDGLNDARIRLDTMSRVHRRLYDPMNANLPLPQYLNDLCQDVLHSTGVDHARIAVQAPPMRFDLDKLLTISLIIVEALTNALKHAFPNGREGRIQVGLVPEGRGLFTLTVHDNGIGFPSGFNPDTTERLGFRILQGFARTLKGEIAFTNDKGGLVRVVFKA